MRIDFCCIFFIRNDMLFRRSMNINVETCQIKVAIFFQEVSLMSLLTLPAHFDGEKICLDEPYRLRPSAKLMVVILPEQERELWPSTALRCGDLQELFATMPRFSQGEAEEFVHDLRTIRTQFNNVREFQRVADLRLENW